MLDTITIRGSWPLRDAGPPRRVVRLPGERGAGVRIRIDVTGRNVDWVEASLPRVLFGHNGRLIATQEELDAALDRLRNIVMQYADVPPVEEWRLQRLDLCWNFDLLARPYIYAHASLAIPGIRKMPVLFGGGSGVSWRGTKSKFVVSLYAKSKKSGATGSVLRAEIRLCGLHLIKRFPHGDWRQFSALWRCFRGVLSSIPPIIKPESVPDLATAVGMEEPEVRNRILARLAGRAERTIRRWRARIEAAQVPGPFSWESYLPAEHPPDAIHVLPPPGRRRA